MKIVGIHHAQITIPKGAEKEGKDFYCGVLRLQEIEKPSSLQGRGGFWLKAGNIDIHVGTEEGFNRLSTKSHLAYQVEDISYWREVLQNNHLKILESIPIENYERLEFRDPFGNRVEMIQKKVK